MTLEPQIQQKLIDNFTRYEQVLNTIFGAAFGIIGSVSLNGQDSLQRLSFLAAFLTISALCSLWVISVAAKFGRTIAQSKGVKLSIAMTALIGLVLACVVVLVGSAMLKDFQIDSRGGELAAVLVGWTTSYLATGLWVAFQRRFL